VGFERYESAGFMINLGARVFERRMAEALAPLGLSPAYLPVIFILSAAGPATQAELARSAEIEQPTMALTLRRMERDGIIFRVPDETDGRRAIVHLTSRAEALVPQIESIAENINSKAFDGMPAGSSAQLIDLLKRAATNLTQRPVE
jgi:MarR family transcriptional regulator, transcriptional regulator for hemolysin